MDNLCHSLAGAAIAQAGFARRLPRATLLAVVAANIPDVDALTYLFGDAATAVSFRRGWTHGIAAVPVWAIVLAALFAWWNRRRPGGTAEATSLRAYLPLAAIAALSHPCLDWLNTYGMRFLMPFSDEWFYGDTLFIVDPVLIALLGLGWFASSRLLKAGSRRAEFPARAAIVAALVYIGAMKWISVTTRDAAVQRFALSAGGPTAVMVAPQPLRWRERDVLVEGPGTTTYSWYTASWEGIRATIGAFESSVQANADTGTVAAVRGTDAGAKFLRWSRFPYFVPGTGADAGTIFVGDARYSEGTTESWAGVRVRLNAQEAPAAR
jgi:inner membrane protein